MLAEISITPLGTSAHLSRGLAEIVQVVDQSDLPFLVTPSGTCIEGTWDEVMPVIRRCHERARTHSSHAVTMIQIEDEAGVSDKLTSNVTAIEDRLGHPLKRHVVVVSH